MTEKKKQKNARHLDPTAIMIRWLIPEFATGMRADQYLSEKVPHLSRTKVQELIKLKDFKTRSRQLKSSTRLQYQEEVELWFIPPDQREITIKPQILYHELGLMVLNKPGNLAIHPASQHYYQTITQWIKDHFQGSEKLAHPCHRLDRETSGILLCADGKSIEKQVKIGFSQSTIKKSYLAIVSGDLVQAQTVTVPLAQQKYRGLIYIKMIPDSQGLKCETHFESLYYDAQTNRSLILCHPKTGRQHQIRAHLAEIGHPILGDKLYQMGEEFFNQYFAQKKAKKDLSKLEQQLEAPRHALHAYQIQLPQTLEKTGIQLAFSAPVPQLFKDLLPNYSFASLTRI